MMYSPSPTTVGTVTSRPLGEWSEYVANISVEPISLAKRERRLPSVNEVDAKDVVVAGID